MLTLISNLVGRIWSEPKLVVPVLPVVQGPTTLTTEVRIYCGIPTEAVTMDSTHDVSAIVDIACECQPVSSLRMPWSRTFLLNRSGAQNVRANVVRDLTRFYRRCREGNNQEPRYRIAFVCKESVENAEQFGAVCEEIARELALRIGLEVRTVIITSR